MPSDEARRLRRHAWISIALISVAFVIAMILGEGLLTLQGYESGSEDAVPIGAALLAGAPALLVMIAPAFGAIWFGLGARRRGEGAGTAPVVVGLAFVTFSVLTNTLPLVVAGR